MSLHAPEPRRVLAGIVATFALLPASASAATGPWQRKISAASYGIDDPDTTECFFGGKL